MLIPNINLCWYTLNAKWHELELKCLPGSAMTLYPNGSFLVLFNAYITLSVKLPAGNPPPTSNSSILWPYYLPISIQPLANSTALPKEGEPY